MRTLSLVLLAGAVSACGLAVQASGAVDHTGTYQLIAVDGRSLPHRPAEAGAPLVLAGTFTLAGDGTFTSTMTFGMTSGDAITRDFSGTYTREESTFRLDWQGAGVTTAILERNTLTMTNEGIRFAYRK